MNKQTDWTAPITFYNRTNITRISHLLVNYY